jgi:hypothetical protein
MPAAAAVDWLTSQNLRIIDQIRAAAGLGNQANYGVKVIPSLQPVLVVDPGVVPPLQYIGTTFIRALAGGAGFRSELAIAIAQGVFPPGGVLKFYFHLRPQVAGSVEMGMGPTLASVTNVTFPYNDARLGLCGSFAISFKNIAAASAIGTVMGNAVINAGGATGEYFPRIGPFYLTDIPGMRSWMIRPTADNVPIAGIFEWEILAKAV